MKNIHKPLRLPIQSALIIYNHEKPKAGEAVALIRQKLEDRGVEVFCAENLLHGKPNRKKVDDILQRVEQVDVILVLGGDGTILGVARLTACAPKPILGINLGTFGFLTTSTISEIDDVIEGLFNGKVTIIHRYLLESWVVRKKRGGEKEVFRSLALNEALVTLSKPGRLLNLRVEENGEPALKYRCDGLIVSTPTGSSGHSLSAGGPILEPHLAALVMTPVSPHSLFNRPLVIDGERELSVRFADGTTEKVLILDGQIHVTLESKDTVYIRRSNHTVPTISLPNQSFTRVLRLKFNLGEK